MLKWVLISVGNGGFPLTRLRTGCDLWVFTGSLYTGLQNSWTWGRTNVSNAVIFYLPPVLLYVLVLFTWKAFSLITTLLILSIARTAIVIWSSLEADVSMRSWDTLMPITLYDPIKVHFWIMGKMSLSIAQESILELMYLQIVHSDEPHMMQQMWFGRVEMENTFLKIK